MGKWRGRGEGGFSIGSHVSFEGLRQGKARYMVAMTQGKKRALSGTLPRIAPPLESYYSQVIYQLLAKSAARISLEHQINHLASACQRNQASKKERKKEYASPQTEKFEHMKKKVVLVYQRARLAI